MKGSYNGTFYFGEIGLRYFTLICQYGEMFVFFTTQTVKLSSLNYIKRRKFLMKKKTFKKIVPAALVGLIIVGGASAWISTKETQVGVNKIKSGTFGIKFVDTSEDTKRENTVITLNGSKAIPMTNKYANDNLEPYNFTLLNDGDVDLAYTLYLVEDENEFKFDFENPDGEYFVNALLEYDYNGLEKILL